MKVLMIINPRSGLSSARNGLLDALNIFSSYGYKVTTYVTQKTLDAFHKASEEGYKYDIVVTCGGDGTLNEVVNGLMKHKKKPMIGYFPSGTMNDFASNFNLNNKWKENAKKICEGKETSFDVGLFNKERYFNYVAAFGAFCDVPYSTPQDIKNAIGNAAYFIEGIRELNSIKPIELSIEVNEKKEDVKAIFGLIFSGNRVSGVKLLDKSKGKMDDGEFNVLIVEYPPNIFEVGDYLKVFARTNSKYFHWYKTNKVKLVFKDNKTIWTLDGEKAKASKEVIIENINKALQIKN